MKNKINKEDMKWGFWQCCWTYQYDNRIVVISSKTTNDLKNVLVNLQDIEIIKVKGNDYLRHPPFVRNEEFTKKFGTTTKALKYGIDCGKTMEEICFDALSKHMSSLENE